MPRNEALVRLHQSLTSRRSDLRKRFGGQLEDLAHTKHSSASGDTADAAFDASGEEMASQMAEIEAKELAQIERALLRLKQGTYGVCEGCSTRIPVARLNALPYSTVCVKCQREVENDANWLESRGAIDWTRMADSDGGVHDREVRISDLEHDLIK